MVNYIISVIVPIYKVENFLEKCLDSIVRQTYKNLEIILVDDGSPDNCPYICEKYASTDQRIKVIHKENGGLSDAKNVGLAASSGDLIIFVDGDDFISPDMLEKMVNEMVNSGSDIVICDYFKVWPDKLIPVYLGIEPCVLGRNQALSLVLCDRISSNSWNKLCRSRLYEKVHFPIGQTYEDIHETYKLFLLCESVSYIKQCLYFYRINPQGICQSNNPRKIFDLYLAFKERLEFAKSSFPNAIDICSKYLFENGITTYNYLLLNSADPIINKNELNNVINYLFLNKDLAYQSHSLTMKKKVQVWLMVNLKKIYDCSYKALVAMNGYLPKVVKRDVVRV